MASLGDLVARVGLDLSEWTAGLGTLNQSLDKAFSDAESKFSGFAALGSSLTSAGTALSIGLTAPLGLAGAAAVKTSEDLNLARLAFTTMLGSAEKAGSFLEKLKQFAATTPFEFPDLVEAAKRMQAMGFSAEQVIPTLRTIGDSVAALGGGKDVINGVTLALGQMQAKGKVSAQEMNQLAERGIPAWEILSKQIGVSIPEAMKLAEKGAITAAQAIPAILQGMNDKFGGQMAQVSKTLTGVWSNFKDQITFTLADLGNTLAPILLNILQAAMPLLDWARDAAAMFAQLPEPVQAGAVAFAAFLAAAGPIAIVIGSLITAVTTIGTVVAPIAGFIGITSTAFLGFAAAIPLVTAALVALGVWVYDNWAGITAVVSQAWDGIGEMWQAAWGPLYPYLIAIWDGIKSATVGTWNAIAGFLGDIWNAIKSAAAKIWGGIVSVFADFLDMARKIPGANKLMNLDDAWKSAQRASRELENTTKQTEKITVAADKLAGSSGRPMPKLAKSLKDVGAEAADVVSKTNPLVRRSEVLFAMSAQLEAQYKKTAKEIAEWKLAHQDAANAVVTLIPPSEALAERIQAISGEMNTAKDVVIPDYTRELRAALQNGAPDESVNRQWTGYRNHVGGVFSGIISESGAMLGGVRGEHDKQLPGIRGAWESWGTGVQQTLGGLSDGLLGRMFRDPGSFAIEAFRDIKGLGKAFLDDFVGVAQKAGADLLNGVLSDLIGGKGFGGLIDRVKGLGDSVSGIFGRGAGSGGGILGGGGAPNIPTGGGGAGGAGSAAGAGISGIVGAVGSVASAVSGIIGNFQQAGMNKSLDIIVLHTLQTANDLANLRRDAWVQHNGTLTKWDDLFNYLWPKLDRQGDFLRDIDDTMNWSLRKLESIDTASAFGSEADKQSVGILAEIRDSLRQSNRANVTVNVSGAAGPEATANAIVARLNTSLAY